MVGDRLDTDIQGGRAAGMATLLVLTGVSDAAELLAAPPEAAPDYVGADLGALAHDPDDLAPGPRPGWTVAADRTGWTLSGAATRSTRCARCAPRTGTTAAARPGSRRRAGDGGAPRRSGARSHLAGRPRRAGSATVAGSDRSVRRHVHAEPSEGTADEDDDPSGRRGRSIPRTLRVRGRRPGSADPRGDGGRRRCAGWTGSAERPLAEHVAVFERVHAALGEALADGPRRWRGSRPSVTAVVTRARLDAELVRRGLARSRQQAAELIEQGRVAVRGVPAGKPATVVDRDTPVTVRRDGRAASGRPAARTS